MATTKKTPAKPRTKKAEPAFSGLPGETVTIESKKDPIATLKGWKFGNADVICKFDASTNKAVVGAISFMGDHSMPIAELANPVYEFDLSVDAGLGELDGLPTILFVCAIDGDTITPSKVTVHHGDDISEDQRRALRRAVFNDPKAMMTVGTEIDLTPPKKREPKKSAPATEEAKKPIAKKTPAKKAPAKSEPSESAEPKPRTRKAPAAKASSGTEAKKPTPRKAPARKAPASKAAAPKPTAKPTPRRKAASS